MACGLLVLTLLLLDLTVPILPELTWNPNISAVQEQRSKALIITVDPKVAPIAYLRVCVNKLSSIHCLGDVTRIESRKDAFRFSITSLASNQSYFIYVKPFSKDDEELDVWIHKKKPIHLEPWQEGSTTTQAPESTDATKEPGPVDSGIGVEVPVVLMVLVVIAIATVCGLWYRGYLQRIWVLRCCFSQSVIPGPPIKVLQLYVTDCEAFQQMVKKHMEFLGHYLNLDSVDCFEMANQQNPDQWLECTSTDRRVVVYVSPQLIDELRQQDVALPNTLASKCVQFLRKISRAAALKKGRRRCRNPILVLSGCFPSDKDDEQYLRHHASLGTLKRYWISRREASELTVPSPLLNKLSGCHPSFHPPSDWPNSHKALELKNAISRLHHMECRRPDCNVNQGGLRVDEQVDNVGCVSMPQCDFVLGVMDRLYTCLPAETQGREGHCPQRTDSGFSSTVDHTRGSNPSSESNSSPGTNFAEELMEEEEEESTERYPMIPFQGPFSVSQISINFQAPESVAGDMSSLVLREQFWGINEKADWSKN